MYMRYIYHNITGRSETYLTIASNLAVNKARKYKAICIGMLICRLSADKSAGFLLFYGIGLVNSAYASPSDSILFMPHSMRMK